MRIDAEVTGGRVQKAWSSGQMFRGIERILQGRDPRDAWLFTQRFCGVCTTVHAVASVRSVEHALGMEVPLNAQYIRNLILAAHAIRDHIVHFYHLSALDWVDVVSALQADPAKASQLASLSPWPHNGRLELKAVQDKLKAFVENGQLGPFTSRYWGHPAMKLSPEVNLLAVSHYLQALDVQRRANQVVAILGGKTPNIQNLAVGGVANAINLDNQTTLNMERLYHIKDILDEVTAFIEQVYFADVCAIAGMYPDWLGYGKGVTNYLSVPDMPLDTKGTSFDLPGGTIMNGDLSTLRAIRQFDEPYFRENVSECIAHSLCDGDWTKHPWDETTDPNGLPGRGQVLVGEVAKFDGKPMQVGPLAQVLVGFAQGHEPTVRWAKKTLETAGSVAGATLGPEVLHSTLGRHAARMIRTCVISELAKKHWQLLATNIGKGDIEANKPTFPKGEGSAASVTRGAARRSRTGS